MHYVILMFTDQMVAILKVDFLASQVIRQLEQSKVSEKELLELKSEMLLFLVTLLNANKNLVSFAQVIVQIFAQKLDLLKEMVLCLMEQVDLLLKTAKQQFIILWAAQHLLNILLSLKFLQQKLTLILISIKYV